MKFEIHPEVSTALSKGSPVVALESTIISHGLPYPDNLELANNLEQILKDSGVTPATIAIIEGKIKIGLTDKELLSLASTNNIRKSKDHSNKHPKVKKLSIRDLAHACTTGLTGTTTVATTMALARAANIEVFVTGGIGGVHRGAEKTFDISADLIQLAKTKVAVVCSGAKSILDLPKTIEFLETYGVPVVAYGQNEFPAFYSRSLVIDVNPKTKNTKKLLAPLRVDSPQEAAALISNHFDLSELANNNHTTGGVLIANPIREEDENVQISKFVDQALTEIGEEVGPESTPKLLARIAELSSGESIKTNIALIRNNALIGAEIAKEIKKLRPNQQPISNISSACYNDAKNSILRVFGGVVLDLSSRPIASNLQGAWADSAPGIISSSIGGVGYNLATAASSWSNSNSYTQKSLYVEFRTIVGSKDDKLVQDFELKLRQSLHNSGCENVLLVKDKRYQLAQYNCILDGKGELVAAVSDMDSLENQYQDNISTSNSMNHPVAQLLNLEKTNSTRTTNESWLVDSNFPASTCESIRLKAAKGNVKALFVDPTSAAKTYRFMVGQKYKSMLQIGFPNLNELSAMINFLITQANLSDFDNSKSNYLDQIFDKVTYKRYHQIEQCSVDSAISAVLDKSPFDLLAVSCSENGCIVGFRENKLGGIGKPPKAFYMESNPSKDIEISCKISLKLVNDVTHKNNLSDIKKLKDNNKLILYHIKIEPLNQSQYQSNKALDKISNAKKGVTGCGDTLTGVTAAHYTTCRNSKPLENMLTAIALGVGVASLKYAGVQDISSISWHT